MYNEGEEDGCLVQKLVTQVINNKIKKLAKIGKSLTPPNAAKKRPIFLKKKTQG